MNDVVSLDIRPLVVDDVPAAVSLSEEAGWNQTPSDWRRLLALSPSTVVGGWVRGELIASSSAVAYGRDLAWIGMVLVKGAHRRRGFGRAVFEHVLERLRGYGIGAFGLDATDYGRPLYLSQGFHEHAAVIRWRGRLRIPRKDEADVSLLDLTRIEAVLEADRRAGGVERSRLLTNLLSDGFCAALPDGARIPSAYAFARAGRRAWQIGPVVAPAAGDLRRLLGGIGKRLDGEEVLMDVIETRRDQAGIDQVLERHGLSPGRRLVRMSTTPGHPPLSGWPIVAAAGLELG